MSKQKRRLTPEEHRHIGGRLKAICAELQTMSCSLPYPKADRSSRQIDKALKGIEGLRCSLDGHFAREVPREEFAPSVYYGGERK